MMKFKSYTHFNDKKLLNKLLRQLHKDVPKLQEDICKLHTEIENQLNSLTSRNESLEIRLNELTSEVDVEKCPHSVFNGEYVACRYYEGQRCDDADFSNCLFRENARLKDKLDWLQKESDNWESLVVHADAQIDEIEKENSSYDAALKMIEEIVKQRLDSDCSCCHVKELSGLILKICEVVLNESKI